MRALVMGARGAVGRVVVEELRSRGHVVTRAGRGAGNDLIGLDLTRLDLTAPEGLRTLAHLSAVHDVVINASGVETPALARCGAPAVVEISATSAYLAALRRALCEDVGGTTMSEASVGTVVTGAGLVPGLSTLLIAELDTEPGDDVDLGVVLGTGEHHGAAAVEWTAGLLGTPVHHPPEGRRIVNLRQSRRITEPSGRRRRYLRADFPDHVLLADRGVRVRSHLALSSRSATGALALAGRVPALGILLDRVPHVGSDEWLVVAQNRRTGRSRAARGRRQSWATGVLTAFAAELVAGGAARGAVTMADLTDAAAAQGRLERPDRQTVAFDHG